MPSSAVLTFADPHPYQAAIRGGQVEIYPKAKGDFFGELTQVDLDRLWLQRGRENLPRAGLIRVRADRAPIGFLANANEAPVWHCGIEVSPGDIIVDSFDSMHRRTEAPSQWASMSLTPDDLAAAGAAIAGRDLTVPPATHIVRPSPQLMSRLLSLHEQVGQLARTAPEKLARASVARALEQALVHAMVMCLTEGTPVESTVGGRQHALVIARLEEFLAANHDRPVYLAEICATTGASERTLRVCCQEHLGMGPVHYLWLRRMHLARRSLARTDVTSASVTTIATDYGFWELGRFSVEYRALFGESPSVTLRRPPDDRQQSDVCPFALPASEFA
jgi:AraC-like DNA-binding protein